MTVTELAPTSEVPEAIAKAVAAGEIVQISDLIKALAPPPTITKVGAVPLPAVVSDEEQAALQRLPEVYGSAVPETRRTLEAGEITSLLQERETLKTVEALVKRRLDDISLSVLNHNDVDYENDPTSTEGVLLGADGQAFITAKGHVVRKAKFRGDDPSLPKLFSVETRSGTPTMDTLAFKDLVSHDDFLACTVQERVWNDNKAMLHLRKKPELLAAFRDAMATTTPSVAVYERANK